MRIEKLLKKLQKKPAPNDFLYKDLVTIFESFGFEVKSGNGSRRKFVSRKKQVFNLHEPHPEKTIKRYVIQNALKFLKDHGYI
ncbi:type II toxin-antitoxin system HicA family toxin [Flammeovirga sp. MY04]|uniref:type II toxin-antitoxin system HicA family toxin n=1 Tax=Flammeovirga sp. MY04 TaxID=1191459 RepID=UPI0008061094|nr:type II toxin-antitoxin system HicA family toxin [Flammeovirga sp. MY04]